MNRLLAALSFLIVLCVGMPSLVKADERGVNLARDIFYEGTIILDRDASLDWRDVLDRLPSAREQPRVRVPPDGNAYWLVADVHNPGSMWDWWVEVFAVRSDYVDLYVVHDGHLVMHRRTGLMPLATGPTRTHNTGSYVLDFELPAGESRTLLVRVQSRSLINYTIMAGPARELNDVRVLRHFALYTLMGGMLALLIYNAFIGFRLRDGDYLFYSFHAASYFAFFLNSYGLAANFLGLTDHPWITTYCGLAVAVSSTLFVRRFLRVTTWNRRLAAFMLLFALGLIALAALAPLLGTSVMTPIWMFAYAVVAPMVLITALLGVRARVRQAWYVLIGWTPMVTMTLLAIAAMAGFVQRPPSGAAINATVFFEMLFMSLALADRVRQLRQEREEALGESAAKSSFLAILSHEVRTPLNGILGTVELLGRTRMSTQQRGYLDTLRHSGQALMTLLDEVLDLAKAEAGRIELKQAPVDPRRLIESMTQLMHGRAESKGIALACRVDPAVPGLIVADEARLRQVLLNLISNAVKFTETGRIDVTLTSESCANGRHLLRWEVQDTGIGIAEGAIDRVFDRFTQIDSSRTRNQGGVGLGLAICKELVALMGGTIGVDSTPGKGSRFWFRIEVPDADSTVSAAQQIGSAITARTTTTMPDTEPVRSHAAPLRVLVVDDVEINRDVLSELLRTEGFVVQTAADGPSALTAVDNGHFDAVVLDVYMPGMDGPTVAHRLRAQGRELAILGLTAAMEPALLAECRDSGMDTVLTKPASIKDLSLTLRQLAGRSADTSALPLLDPRILDGFRSSLGNKRIEAIVQQFRERADTQLGVIASVIADADVRSVASEAHRFAGMAATLGLIRLAAMAEELSAKARHNSNASAFAAEAGALRQNFAPSLEALSALLGSGPSDAESPRVL
ncbi:MAG: hybrid sensor histidine kinase/response regulator [Burkholderiales bacterium]|nr:MAG: hybrid sensor histidine kinase/response regulator [Burkholderiales bacterium]